MAAENWKIWWGSCLGLSCGKMVCIPFCWWKRGKRLAPKVSFKLRQTVFCLKTMNYCDNYLPTLAWLLSNFPMSNSVLLKNHQLLYDDDLPTLAWLLSNFPMSNCVLLKNHELLWRRFADPCLITFEFSLCQTVFCLKTINYCMTAICRPCLNTCSLVNRHPRMITFEFSYGSFLTEKLFLNFPMDLCSQRKSFWILL